MLEGGALHRGRESNRGPGCGQTARPGLHGGCRVTGIPTVEADRKECRSHAEIIQGAWHTLATLL
jgi:hypothetical protein